MNIIRNIKWSLGLALVAGIGFTSCSDEPDKYQITSGTPTINYIRLADATKKDSLLTGASLSTSLCIVGNNLTSIKEMYFNDKKATLNTSYITKNTMLVSVPNEIPGSNTGKIYMVTSDADTVTYDFNVTVPAPSVATMDNEWAKVGETATIKGQYFVNDPNQPLSIRFVGEHNSINVPVPAEDIEVNGNSSVSFVVPEGAEQGQIEVSTIYGTALSQFYFHDKRNVITDFDGPNNSGSETGIVPQGWNIAATYSTVNGVDGYYVQLGDGTTKTDGGWFEQFKLPFWCGNWNGDPMSIKKGNAGVPIRNCFDLSDWQNMSFKFELYIPSAHPWSAGALQILFVNNELCANDSWQNNTYIRTSADGGLDLPRALYIPWKDNGSFDTDDKWITVTIPLTDFTYNMDGSKSPNSMDKTSFDSFIMWPINGGVTGTECAPIFRIDNPRIVPNL